MKTGAAEAGRLSVAVAVIARSLGYSVALGAFLAGAIAAESGESRILEPLVRPVREIFAAIFFVSVGMLVDPALIVESDLVYGNDARVIELPSDLGLLEEPP